jgi:hypothetical protein
VFFLCLKLELQVNKKHYFIIVCLIIMAFTPVARGVLTGEALLTTVQETTFDYFWDFAHPTSGLAREGFTTSHNGDTCTTGGSGMGLMTIVVGVERGFVTRTDAANRILTMVSFLEDDATRYHGAWPHWFNGQTGATIPFTTKDNGADLVETAYLIQGMLTVRQYFDGADPVESEIRTRINRLWEEVEWDWFLNGGDTLFWHWSPDPGNGWQMNMLIRGFNETMITYILAIASPTYPIPASSYYDGWAGDAYANGKAFYGHRQWVGDDLGGPLFFTHYSFLGFDPRNKRDNYCNYFENNRNIALIHQAYSIDNPSGYVGYGADCWGLTASTNPWGYLAHSPTNDNGTITPTAAVSSIPYTPVESMLAMEHFYNDLGTDLWGTYGFRDAFNLTEDPDWYSNTWLAIDEGTIVPMIENYRTGLCWDLFMSNSEIQPALDAIGWATGSGSGLTVKYYEGSWTAVPDFDTLTPIFEDVASIPTASIRNADDDYGLRFSGYISIETAGTYTFHTTSDDGSQLTIDGTLVVNNDGLHGPAEVSGDITLSVGRHSIQVDYFEAIGGAVLEASYEGPGIAKQIIPVNVLFLCNLAKDLNNDCVVNLEDFAILAIDWLGSYDINDLAEMTSEWLL